MNRILETFGFKNKLNLTLKMQKSEFINLLKTKTKPNRLIFLDLLDSEQKEFYGRINENSFWLRKAGRFTTKCHFANASGTIKSESNNTFLEIKIKGWNWFVLLWLALLTLMLGLIFSITIRNDTYGLFVIFGPVFLIFYLFAFFKMRQGVRRFKNYLRAELSE